MEKLFSDELVLRVTNDFTTATYSVVLTQAYLVFYPTTTTTITTIAYNLYSPTIATPSDDMSSITITNATTTLILSNSTALDLLVVGLPLLSTRCKKTARRKIDDLLKIKAIRVLKEAWEKWKQDRATL